ncbi:MAG TPA: S26 family signal peptidase [Rectinemataceae bacterium]
MSRAAPFFLMPWAADAAESSANAKAFLVSFLSEVFGRTLEYGLYDGRSLEMDLFPVLARELSSSIVMKGRGRLSSVPEEESSGCMVSIVSAVEWLCITIYLEENRYRRIGGRGIVRVDLPKRKAKKAYTIGWLIVFACVISVLVLLRTFVIDLAIASGDSMQPGIESGDLIIVFKAAYGLRMPGQGYLLIWARPRPRDIVAAIRPDGGSLLVKRIAFERPGAGRGDPVFLLGDNLHESRDSREFGLVPMNNVLGKVFPL